MVGVRMSDALIERVEYVIEYQIQNHGFGPHVSRAAVRAVLEWYSEPGNVSPPMYGAAAIRRLSLSDMPADIIAAAMKAELDSI